MVRRAIVSKLFTHGVRRHPRSFAAMRGAGGHMQPPFVQRAAVYDTMPEGDELVWDDGVAPETCLDFDAEHISSGQAWGALLGSFVFFGALYSYQSAKDPEAMRPTADRVMPYGNLHLALGGDPKKMPGATEDSEEE
eukprot:g2554.t1